MGGDFRPTIVMTEATISLFDTIEEALVDIAAGRPVIVTDDEGRENEGDLILAAEKATPETVNMMIRHARGLICVPMMEGALKRLGIARMVAENRESQGTDFTVSVDAMEGISTGISAADRTRTIRVLADPKAKPEDLVRPGHIFPLRARPGGVLERAGHTEAAVDLARLAGLTPTAVICEILNEDGSCARIPDLLKFRQEFDLKLVSIAQLIEYRHRREQLVLKVMEAPFPSDYGEFRLHVFQSQLDGNHHFAFSMGELTGEPTLVRVHSENLLSDLFALKGMRSRHCLQESMERIAEEGNGVLLYMAHPCGGLQLPALGDEPPADLNPVKMDFRAYGVGAQILCALGLQKIRLLSSTQRKVVALDGYGLEIIEQVGLG